MKFFYVAEVFNKIEAVPGRLEMTQILSDLFKEATAEEAREIAYLSLGELKPPYIFTQFNFAEKNAVKVVVRLLGLDESEVKHQLQRYGDLGLVVEKLGAWHYENKLSLTEVYNQLCEMEQISGTGSQEAKQDQVYSILNSLNPVGAKFVIRILTGKLRLGFSDMTIVDALSWMLVGDKSVRKDLERAYNYCADIGRIAFVAKQEGIEGIKKMQVVLGIPIRPAAADRLPTAADIIKKIGTCVAQPKLDGFRLQIHLDNTGSVPLVKLFSRNLIDMTHMFPDLVEALKKVKVKSLICEGEAISYDPNSGTFVVFQETVKRKRKHGIEAAIEEFPLRVYLFDLMYLDGKQIMQEPQSERYKKLTAIFADQDKDFAIQPISEKKFETAAGLKEYFTQNIADGLEGLVAKKPDAPYRPGKRDSNWIKLKREETNNLDDTLDCVVLGYYFGKGKRVGFGIGALLVGVYNKEKDMFESIAKIGTGLTDDGWKEIKEKSDKFKLVSQPKNVVVHKGLTPNVWVAPEIVVLVRADEITISPTHAVGYALRFPRFMGYRPDKSATDATTGQEVRDLFELQKKH
jgi:DNA ligase 1